MMGTREELAQVSRVVRLLLEDDIRCRNDDKWLTYRVMRYFTNIFIPFDDFSKIPAFDSIRRTRQKFQADGRFLPTDPDVIVRRKLREDDIRAWAVGR